MFVLTWGLGWTCFKKKMHETLGDGGEKRSLAEVGEEGPSFRLSNRTDGISERST